jgi:glycerol-3-phosphate acyltransferase PlsX
LGAEVVLVGQKEKVLKELGRYPTTKGIEVVDARDVVDMEEPAAISIRKKKDASIVVAVRLMREGYAQAVVGAGNTGAAVCAAVLELGMLPGVERPGIAIVMPTLKGISLVIDVGANIDPKPEHLLQYGIMGSAYAEYVLKKPRPAVGLLNIGEEASKGTDFLKESFRLLSASPLNFIGNVEGKDIFSGKSDVVVTDGFVGNVALKVSESVAEAVSGFLRDELSKSLTARVGVYFMRKSLRRFKKRIDYSEYGGAPLLGVNGILIIGHGRSSGNAIKNAIRVAKEEVEYRVNERIVEAIQKYGKA